MNYKLELTDQEASGLRDLIKHVLDTRNVELHRTEAFAYKEMLKTRIEIGEHILRKLEQVQAAHA